MDEDPKLLSEAVVVKLNGGPGTGMGLDKAKSLLPVKGDDTFLDFIAKQVKCPSRPHSSVLRWCPSRLYAPEGCITHCDEGFDCGLGRVHCRCSAMRMLLRCSGGAYAA